MATYFRSKLPKECCKCQKIKPASDFATAKYKRSGLYSYCRSCSLQRSQLSGNPRTELPKECMTCKQIKPASGFNADKRNQDGLYGYCRPCHGLAQRRSRYQLRPAEFKAMLEAQGNACAICSDQFTDKRVPHVDHDHACCPGKSSCGVCVRGLLCGPCNKGIGCLMDSPQRLRQAILYLERLEGVSI